MNTYAKMLPHIESSDYETHFWNAIRGDKDSKEHLVGGLDRTTRAYSLTAKANDKYMTAVKNESIFRTLATDINAYGYDSRIKTVVGNDLAVWVPEGGVIPVSDSIGDFGDISLGTHKVAVFLKIEDSFVQDNSFMIEDYLVKRLAKNFGRAEDNGFINGNGIDAPTGILADNGGAEVGVTANEVTYDDVIRLYFSVKPEYRKNGVWLMNDETALVLRTLKDNNGNYIWNHTNDTILGKKVVISEFMPSAEDGSKPIVFGDFSYYWIVGRRPVSVRTLVEQFANVDCLGYLAYEYLDGKLVRPEAIKALKITA